MAPLSLEELHDTTSLRILIETEALEASIRNGDDAWASGIVSSLYALNVQAARTGPDADIWTLEKRHHAFHRALLAACNSPWTLEFFERLYAATERYRIPVLLASALPVGRDVQAEHSALAQAALDRNAKESVRLARAALSPDCGGSFGGHPHAERGASATGAGGIGEAERIWSG